MPVHDWTRVEAGIFHDFHNAWVIELRNALNGGLLPRDYYALTEQHAGRYIADLLTLYAGGAAEAPPLPPLPPPEGAIAVAEAPPKVRRTLTGTAVRRRRSLAIRHVSGHRLIALVEIVSPANKDRTEHVTEFADKVIAALERGVHVLLLDLFPPTRRDPRGIHGAVWDYFDDEPYEVPEDEPLTLTSYAASSPPVAYVEHRAVGGALPEMPLFLRGERYIHVPLELTYEAAYRGFPAFWRDVLEGRRQPGE
jgi:hypothetical protein